MSRSAGSLRSQCLSIGRVAGEQPQRLALIDGDAQVSYADLLLGAQAAQAWLFSQGLLDQPLLAVVAEASRRSIELVLAAIDLGLPLAFVHPRLHPAERAQLLGSFQCTRAATLLDLGATELAAPAELWGCVPGTNAPTPKKILELRGSAFAKPPSNRPADSASLDSGSGRPERAGGADWWRRWQAVLFTSGSTGAPKAVALGAAQILAAVQASEQNLGWQDQDRWLLSLPVAHVGGLSIVLRCLAASTTVVLPAPGSGLDLRRLTGAAERHAVSLMSVVPTQLERLCAWQPPRSLRAVLVGGAAARQATLAAARRSGLPTLTTYGATEACSQIATAPPGSPLRDDDAVGPAVADTELQVRDGRIWVRGPQLMRGYLAPASPAAQIESSGGLEIARASGLAEGGWLETSDAGELTGDGWLRVLGRLDDVIITGGENVHPAEVEQVLLGHAAVQGCVVAGVSDPSFGQIVGAVLVGRAELEAEVLDYCRQALAAHKRPRSLVWVASLPQLPNGKLDRRGAQRVLAETARR